MQKYDSCLSEFVFELSASQTGVSLLLFFYAL